MKWNRSASLRDSLRDIEFGEEGNKFIDSASPNEVLRF